MAHTSQAAAALKSYVYFAEAQDGVYFGGGTEHFLIKGAGIYPLVSRLVSLLDGSRSIEAISDALPVKARSFFGVLVGELRARQMLRECLPSNDNISDDEWRLYRETLLYLRDRTAGYATLFRAWRARDNVVIGGGICAKALLRGLARTGAGRIQFFHQPCGIDDLQRSELARVLEDHGARDEAFCYEVTDIEALSTARADGARLIYASDRLHSGVHAGLHFAGGFINHQAIVAGGAGAHCDAILTDLAARLTEGQAGAYSAVTSPSVIGNLLAFEILRSDVAAFTNNPQAASAGAAHFLHLSPGGEITTHRLPQAHPNGDANTEPQAPGFDPFDPLVGVFEHLPALDGYRLPLPHARIQLRLPGGGEAEEIAWGVKQIQAESDVVLKAAARYAALAQPSAHRTVAAPSRESWMQLALAAAIVDSALFSAAETTTLAAESLDDAEFQFLARIARLYADKTPTIMITSVAGLPAYLAQAEIGAFTARAISSSRIEAICNALGQACSQMQLSQTGREAEPVLVAVRTPLDAAIGPRRPPQTGSDACIALLARAGFSIKPMLHADPALHAAKLYAGAVELTPIGAAA